MLPSAKKNISPIHCGQVTPLLDLSADVLRFLDRKRDLNNYDIQEKILRECVEKYPGHDNYAAVEVKAKLLNLFYSTGIKAIDKVIEKIMSIDDIDSIFKMPMHYKKLVDSIAELNLNDGNKRTNYSFATKYCALHQPKKYPIYDSIVATIFTKLMVQGNLPPYIYNKGRTKNSKDFFLTKGEFMANLHDYDFFVNVYKTFMNDYGLDGMCYREVDLYLWGSYKDGSHESLIEKIVPLKEGKDYTIIKLKKAVKKIIT